ncbi:hypothetical protein PhCBS80983_g01756 [Powellomyces hirtus]|uniref:Ubiquinol-cytochrome c chaperone domain-containing protein n=1 Tax=Powellomyces hirtus TaxID=109895 RepID=A0A507EA00_9FUNG|nr:hypothetical protein PhCBS80983_g01756 [Powellomyces hirtus]
MLPRPATRVCRAAAATLAPRGVPLRQFGTSGVQSERESFPYQNAFSKLLHPIGYIKWKMNRIDSARHGYEACSGQFDKRAYMVKAFNLPDNFQTWFAMTVLHVWMYNARLRAEGLEGKEMKQEMFDHIWLDVEIKIHKAGVKTQISKIMSNLVSAYYGQTLAYDEGLYYGDAILAGALWRNLIASQDVDAAQMEALLTYVRKQLQRIDAADRAEILEGRFSFDEVPL